MSDLRPITREDVEDMLGYERGALEDRRVGEIPSDADAPFWREIRAAGKKKPKPRPKPPKKPGY